MAVEVIIHLQNEDPVLAELDEMPDPTHQCIFVNNPRRRDGRQLHYVTEGATSFIFPWTRITFIEIMGEEEAGEVIEFFRD
ncbi:MAG TPA: hypothetical protein VLY63_11025 [Anaerolineae bacterium]|nr:hypothetical protein [Anaerolineae bacterium]